MAAPPVPDISVAGYLYYTPTAEQRNNTGYAQEDCDRLVAPQWQELFEERALKVLRKLEE